MMQKFSNDAEAIDFLSEKYGELKNEVHKVIIGQDKILHSVLVSIFSKGHCLLIGVPGLAKTLLVQTIANALDLQFNRIQFTPDLMPSDITGSEILNDKKEFQFVRGPIFANILLADEINRTPPKTQAALLEAMQEKNVTVGGRMHKIHDPFFVLATQNPIEQEGTYPLPEAQLDRFMFNIQVEYPTFQEEIDIVKSTTSDRNETVSYILNADEIIFFQNLVRKIPVTDNVLEYIVDLVHKTRPNTEKSTAEIDKYVSWGAGPRASQNLTVGAKCHAALNGKYSPDIEDVKLVAAPVLRHRIVRNFKAEAEGITEEKIISDLL